MPTQPDSNAIVDAILELERQILSALCAPAAMPPEREAAMSQLALHTWRAPEHRVVYEALTRMRSRDAAALRAELPSMATRMGFPDVDWNEYFGRNEIANADDIEPLLRRLVASSAGASTHS